MDDMKIQVIHNWLTPCKVKDIQSFLGFSNFYQRFIASYSNIMIPLTHLTHKDTPWVWSLQCKESFQLKITFMLAPILHHFNPSLPPIIETDASDYAVAGIFSVCTDDGEIHPVAFFSCMLSGAELNYNTHDKELLAIFKAFKTWFHYLESPHHAIDIIADHKNLKYFSLTKVLTRHQARWSEYLSAFNMVICFQPGKLSEKPDSLTHHADFYLKKGDRDFTLVNPPNLCPIFTQEQLATSLHMTRLCNVASNTAVLVDTSIPILNISALVNDIKASCSVNPIANKELDHCLRGSPLCTFPYPPQVSCLLTTVFMSWTTDQSKAMCKPAFSSRNTTI